MMILLTTNDLLNLVDKSEDSDLVKLRNIKILKEFEVSNAESTTNGIRLYFRNHNPIELKGVTMLQLFRPNHN